MFCNKNNSNGNDKLDNKKENDKNEHKKDDDDGDNGNLRKDA